MTYLPENKVSIDYEDITNEFRIKLLDSFKDRLVSILITGSYVRGDAKENSDLDVWCIVDELSVEDMQVIGKIVSSIKRGNNGFIINPQCFSLSEFQNEKFNHWTELQIKALDSVSIHGNLIEGIQVNKEKIKDIYNKYLIDVLMGIRHYISVDKDKEALTYDRISRFILKPLMFPLRLERYYKTGVYPVSNIQLFEAYEESLNLPVKYYLFPESFTKDIIEDHNKVLSDLHNIVLDMIIN